jgi:hypothetical protein
MPALAAQATYWFIALIRQLACPIAFEPARRRHTPIAHQRRAISPPWSNHAHRLVVIAWPDRRRVATKSEASAEMVSAEMASAMIQRSCFFCEHHAPPSRLQPEASGSGRLDPAAHRLAVDCTAIGQVAAPPRCCLLGESQVDTAHLRSVAGVEVW